MPLSDGKVAVVTGGSSGVGQAACRYIKEGQGETRTSRVMETNEALEAGNPSEKWDWDAWSSSNQIDLSSKNRMTAG